jgi:hypothetical protein
MGSLYLNYLSAEQRKDLERRLHESQRGACFICDKPIDLVLHVNAVDIDHVEPIKTGGKDIPDNFALTHASCNRSKQASDLRVARVLARFAKIRDELGPDNRGPNLGDILGRHGGSCHDLPIHLKGNAVLISFPEMSRNEIIQVPLYNDELSGVDYFFAKLPIEYLFHDDRINPRAVGGSLNVLIDEFHKKRPQLHVALAWAELADGQGKTQIRVFDGQHKATAQILLGARELPVRVFLNPDLDILLTTNTNAGTTLRQVAFDKSVQRHLGNALFVERVERYRKDRGLNAEDESFSEKDMVNHFKGEWREMRRYVLDAVRDGITHNPENKLKDYIDFGGKTKERPFSYSTIEKTFYSFFIYPDVLDTPLNYRIEEGENPRELEKEQILHLMNLIAEQLYVGHFDPSIGTSRIENRLQKGEDIPEPHLRAYRLAREEILYSWLRFIKHIVQNFFITTGLPVKEERLFQYRFPQPLWESIEAFLESWRSLPLWVNRELSLSVFGGRQNYEYWQTIFESGKTPQGQQVLSSSINLMQMIKRA